MMTLIKYCSINNEGGPVINLQCSRNSTNAVSFYTQNGFIIIPTIFHWFQKQLNQQNNSGLMKLIWVWWFVVVITLVSKGKKIDDKSNEVRSHQDSNQIIDLSLDNRSDEIKLSDEKFQDLIKKINIICAGFNAEKYMKSTVYDRKKRSYPEGEFDKRKRDTFLQYPPNEEMIRAEGIFDYCKLNNMMQNFPVLRQLIHPVEESSFVENIILPATMLYVEQQANFHAEDFLP